MSYELVAGLETHIELSTKTKIFCQCTTEFGGEPNTHCCPICIGMPGTLPKLNKKVVEYAVKAGIALNCKIRNISKMDRKNYVYPDLPKAYQISQFDKPICYGGYIKLSSGKNININRIHIEEDAGKLVHERGNTYIDYNRGGVPLIEIVSEPDFHTSDEVVAYLEKLQSLLTFADVSDCKMQEGSMRCDVNISVREAGTTKLGTRTEMKNLNSFKAIARAIEYESQRQISALETGDEEIIQETRRWDDTKGESYAMRNKEDANDYRYFPNPDIMPVHISEEWISEVKSTIPELAQDKYERLTGEYGLSDYDSKLISGSKKISDIFDGTLEYVNNPKEVANWIIVDLASIVNEDNKAFDEIDIDYEKFGKVINMVDKKTVNRTIGKKILQQVYTDNVDPEDYAKENKLGMIADTGLLKDVISKVIKENEKSILEFKSGNQKVIGFFMGKIMRETQGKADPNSVKKILIEELENYNI